MQIPQKTQNPAFGGVLADSNRVGHPGLGITSSIAEPQSVSSSTVDNLGDEPVEGFAPSEPGIPSPGPNSITGSDVSYQSETQKVKTGKILVFVNLGYSKLDDAVANLGTSDVPGTSDVQTFTNAWSVDQVSGKVNVSFFGNINMQAPLEVCDS